VDDVAAVAPLVVTDELGLNSSFQRIRENNGLAGSPPGWLTVDAFFGFSAFVAVACRWFLGQRSAFARQSRRLGPGGWLAGCVWGGRFPCSRCLSRALRCSLVAAFTHSGGLLRPPGTFGSRFAHSWSFEEPIIVGSYRSRSRPRARGLVKNPTLSELGMIFQRQARWFGVARPRSRRRKPGGSPPNFNYEWD